jgi:hypothetical protein
MMLAKKFLLNWRRILNGNWIFIRSPIFLFFLLLSHSDLFAQKTDGDTVKSITAVRINGGAKIDGILDEDFWQKASRSGDFTQYQPDEGKPATESTFVRVAYDDEALYVGMEMYDSEPEKIIDRLTRRDRAVQADLINVIVDSHHDHQTAYAFTVYVSGTQKDSYYYNDNSSDDSWDAVWESAAKRTNLGWTAELKIPFHCLRFACQENPIWGIYFSRQISRKNELDRWVYIPQKTSGFVSFFGHLKGLTGLTPPKRLEILPYAVSFEKTEAKSLGNSDGRDFFGNSGFDLKYGITSNITLDATVNPDFGQVEADQTVLNLSTFETFYQEKRPFFLEGFKIFETPFQLFYSRRIGRPPSIEPESVAYYIDKPASTTILGAGKITGKTRNGTSIGILEAVTQREKAEFLHLDGYRKTEVIEPEANYFVARFMQDIWKNSCLGIMATAVNQKSFDPAYTGGVDWTLRFHQGDYLCSGQMIGSRTALSNDGRGGAVGIEKEGGEHILGSLQIVYLNQKLDLNRLGYLQRADCKELSAWLQYKTTKKWWIVRKTWNNLNLDITDNLSGVRLTRGGNFNNSIELTNFWNLGGGTWLDFDTQYDDRETRGGPPSPIPIGQSWWFWLNTDSRKWWQLNPNIEGGDTRDGHYNYYGLWLSIQPKSNIEFSGGPGFTRSDGVSRWITYLTDENGKRTDDIFGEQHVRRFDMTIRGTWTFSKNLTLQIYAQPFMAAVDYRNFKKLIPPDRFEYVDTTVFKESDYQPDFNWKSFNSNVVLRWEYRPGSTLFLVWTQSREGYNTMGDFRFRRDWDNLFDTIPGNTFLIKLNYWWSI